MHLLSQSSLPWWLCPWPVSRNGVLAVALLRAACPAVPGSATCRTGGHVRGSRPGGGRAHGLKCHCVLALFALFVLRLFL